MVQTPTKLLSLAEFRALPETEPASEYINGKIIQKPMPQGKHSIIQRELSFALTLAFRPTGIAQAFPELRCTFGDRSLIPDIAVFSLRAHSARSRWSSCQYIRHTARLDNRDTLAQSESNAGHSQRHPLSESWDRNGMDYRPSRVLDIYLQLR